MKDLTDNIKRTKEYMEMSSVTDAKEYHKIQNQIAIMEALQDIQEKMTRIEGKMRGIK